MGTDASGDRSSVRLQPDEKISAVLAFGLSLQLANADVYVFALHAHKDQESIDPMNLDQWAFYVLSRAEVSGHKSRSFSLSALGELTAPVAYDRLAEAIERTASNE